jgi:carbamoylphosphate synthase large subunit
VQEAAQSTYDSAFKNAMDRNIDVASQREGVRYTVTKAFKSKLTTTFLSTNEVNSIGRRLADQLIQDIVIKRK